MQVAGTWMQRWAALLVACVACAAISSQPAMEIELHSGTRLEKQGRRQLQRLLRDHDLRPWLFTTKVRIQSRVIPHSHPVLTLNTRYVRNDSAQLSTFVHEQLHWYLSKRVDRETLETVLTELRARYPSVPDQLPEGARDERSTYLHLVICYLEFAAMSKLIGETPARARMKAWTHYTWVYRTVLAEAHWLSRLLGRHGIEPDTAVP